jgi:hypothetical protein
MCSWRNRAQLYAAFQGFPAVESLALHKRVNAAGAIRQSATQKDPIPGICVLQGLAEEPLAGTT